MSLADTLGNVAWLKANEAKIKAILPETWTHAANLNGLKLGFNLKLLGIDWRSEEEFSKCMVFFERAGFMLREGLTFKRNPASLFGGSNAPR